MVDKKQAVSRMSLLTECADSFGYETVEEMLQASICDSVVPAICRVCGYTTDMEPDQNRGWCEECEKNTIVSVLVLAGVI